MNIVYGIKNIDNKKIYVGSTNQKTKRWYEHRRKLMINEHTSKHLQYAWNKYGECVFMFFIIETVNNYDDLISREQYWIDFYHDKHLLYNSSLIADNCMRYEHNRNKLSNSLKGIKRNMSGKNNPNYGNKWTNEMKLIQSKKRKNKCIGDTNPSKRLDVKKKISKSKMGEKNPRAKKYRLTSPSNEVYIIHGGIKRKLKENFGLSYISFRDVLKGKRDTCKGWKLEIIT